MSQCSLPLIIQPFPLALTVLIPALLPVINSPSISDKITVRFQELLLLFFITGQRGYEAASWRWSMQPCYFTAMTPGVQGRAGWGFEQHDLVESVSDHGIFYVRLENGFWKPCANSHPRQWHKLFLRGFLSAGHKHSTRTEVQPVLAIYFAMINVLDYPEPWSSGRGVLLRCGNYVDISLCLIFIDWVCRWTIKHISWKD